MSHREDGPGSSWSGLVQSGVSEGVCDSQTCQPISDSWTDVDNTDVVLANYIIYES